MSSPIYVVIDDDYPVAVYQVRELAEKHATEMGYFCAECEISESLPEEVTSPEKIAERAAEREHEQVEYRERQKREEQQLEATNRLTITEVLERGGNPQLCHCAVFSGSDRYFITPNGYCRYCGCWIPEVFMKHCSRELLFGRISELDLHYRTEMMRICGLLEAR